MHAIELAILVARLIDGTVLMRNKVDWKQLELETYWSASRIRLDRWTQLLKQLPTAAQLLEASQDRIGSDFGDEPMNRPAPNTSEAPTTESSEAPVPSSSMRRAHRATTRPPGPHLAADLFGSSPADEAKYDNARNSASDPTQAASDQLRRLFEEILVSEIQCRVFTCLLQQAGGRETTQAAASVVRSIWLGHQEMRCRVLAWLADGIGAGLPLADEVNRTRRRCERWSDLLLARMGGELAQSFAVDSARYAQFVETEESTLDTEVDLEPLIRGSLEQLVGLNSDDLAACPDLNHQIYSALESMVGSPVAGPSLGNLQEQIARLVQRMEVWIEHCNEI
ncbi:MAG: hypothetical protein KDA83_17490 [Planctomycetales bacterium]|nr:hypothetical protein [Planctomycetales bacterium]